jgi:hypothetical protein
MATLIKSDLEFILQQILIAEAHAAGADLTILLPNAFAPLGLRTVDGSLNGTPRRDRARTPQIGRRFGAPNRRRPSQWRSH